jgi:RNA polymerase sigma-70 factor (ECF subfamily)
VECVLSSKQTDGPALPPHAQRQDDVQLEEHALIARAAGGDAVAARALVQQQHGGMYALALRMTGDPVEAEDLVQEAFARAFAHFHGFDSQYRLSTWLHRIVLNSCRDHLKSPRRRERPTSEQIEPARPGNGSDPMIDDDRARRLHRALSALRPNYREIIVMKDLMELSFAEIRAVTGAPIPGLKIRAIRARARLRKLLEHEV